MKEKIIIVGSGASGVHCALSLLRKGYHVTMLDVGNVGPQAVNPQDSFNDLKNNLSDPVKYFLGENFQAVIFPDVESEYYGFPPCKDYVFAHTSDNNLITSGFAPLLSFAQGGLAEAWTGGTYPFSDVDLKNFPFSYKDIEPYYEEVCDRIGITGLKDDLAEFFPFQKNLMEPLDLDEHSQLLIEGYSANKEFLTNKLGFFLGRSRTATLSKDIKQRKKCNYDGRCLWGCPLEALYTPSVTLRECMTYPNFNYINNLYVTHFKFNSENRITSVIAQPPKGKGSKEFAIDKLVLAAGALSSSRIFLTSLFFDCGQITKLEGLMDNRQIMVPFVNLKMLGKSYNPATYQYHQIAISLKDKDPQYHTHGLITTLKTALIHPLIQSVPFDLRTSVFIFRNLHSALGLVNVNFPDQRRTSNYLTLEPVSRSKLPKFVMHYIPEETEKSLIKKTMKRLKKALRRLGCIVPPGMVHSRPMGASVHYAGTIPMSTEKRPFTVSEYCLSHDFDNLYIVDGSTFPFLPAKNLTFTLMANAIRVAETSI